MGNICGVDESPPDIRGYPHLTNLRFGYYLSAFFQFFSGFLQLLSAYLQNRANYARFQHSDITNDSLYCASASDNYGVMFLFRSGMRTNLRNSRNSSRRGSSIIEFSLIFPWYVFLFVGAFDSGFFAYALIATQNAARAAAVYCSSSASAAIDTANACIYAADQLRGMPNIGASYADTCSGSPLTVTAALLNGASNPQSADGSPATKVTVTYVTPQLIPIPGVFPGQLTITRSVEIRTGS